MENKNYTLFINDEERPILGLSKNAAKKLQKERGGIIFSIGNFITYRLGEHLNNETGVGRIIEMTDVDVNIQFLGLDNESLEAKTTQRIYFDEITSVY
jgi:hypothetical protein